MNIISVLEGFKEDVTLLCLQFQKVCDEQTAEVQSEMPNGNFNQFRMAWCQMKFPLIFHGFVQENRLKEFLDEAFCSIVLWIDESVEPLLNQVAFVYLLYSVYYRQPISPKMRIRVKMNQMALMRSLMDKFLQQKLLDPVFCWNKLMADGAVWIVCHPQWFGPSVVKNKGSLFHSSDNKRLLNRDFKEQLRELSAFHRDYVKIKTLVQGEGEQEIQTMDIVDQLDPLELCTQKLNELMKQVSSEEEEEDGEESDLIDDGEQ
jgi:hypothetical protein